MKIARFTERISYQGKSPQEKQQMISLGEAYSLWTTLEMRYDALMTSKLLLQMAKDEDLKKIIKHGIEVLNSQKRYVRTTNERIHSANAEQTTGRGKYRCRP